jgi:hypothetical protein
MDAKTAPTRRASCWAVAFAKAEKEASVKSAENGLLK